MPCFFVGMWVGGGIWALVEGTGRGELGGGSEKEGGVRGGRGGEGREI